MDHSQNSLLKLDFFCHFSILQEFSIQISMTSFCQILLEASSPLPSLLPRWLSSSQVGLLLLLPTSPVHANPVNSCYVHLLPTLISPAPATLLLPSSPAPSNPANSCYLHLLFLPTPATFISCSCQPCQLLLPSSPAPLSTLPTPLTSISCSCQPCQFLLTLISCSCQPCQLLLP